MVSRICWFTLPFIVPAHLCSLTKDTPFCQPNSHNKKKIVQCAHPCEPASVLHSVSISEIMIWVSQGGCCFYLFCFSVDVRLYTSVAMLFFFTSEYCLLRWSRFICNSVPSVNNWMCPSVWDHQYNDSMALLTGSCVWVMSTHYSKDTASDRGFDEISPTHHCWSLGIIKIAIK